jgi:hypothetical protein
VHLIEGTGRCAMSKAPEVVPQIIAWRRNPLNNSMDAPEG